MLTDADRRRFDDLLDALVDELPDHLRSRLEEIPVVVEDRPSRLLLDELGLDGRVSTLCGLHSGIPLTQRSVEHSGVLPDRIMLFREPIMRLAGHRRAGASRFGALTRAAADASLAELERQIRITLLHEIGHHFGLDEDDLTALGYG